MAGPTRVPHEDEARQLDTHSSVGVVAGWRLVCVSTSLVSKFHLWYQIALAGWRDGRVSHSGRL